MLNPTAKMIVAVDETRRRQSAHIADIGITEINTSKFIFSVRRMHIKLSPHRGVGSRGVQNASAGLNASFDHIDRGMPCDQGAHHELNSPPAMLNAWPVTPPACVEHNQETR